MHTLPRGFPIDEYKIDRVLGAGGFGVTYLAVDHNLDGPVAIKEYFPADIAVRTDGARVSAAAGRSDIFAWGLDRFLREARAIHRLRHPSIVRVHRYVERHGTAYIVMEYVEGESLDSILKSRGQLPADEWRPWLDRLLDGLAHVHDQGYLHRDIKPANIVIRAADREPVLIDFGAARVASPQRTQTQVLTPGYAPFEQHTSGAQRPPTDIYAMAAVSYRALTGEPPPNAPDRMLDDRYKPLAESLVRAPTEWLAAIDHGLALRPEDRPQTVAAWRAALCRRCDRKPLSAAEIEELDEACQEGDEQARRDLLDEANAGNPDAMVALGRMCDSVLEAAEWFHKAAAQGHVEAQFELGDLGEEATVAWYRKAASQGHVGAQYVLGGMYASGYGDTVLQDSDEAVAWFQKAAKQGHMAAQFRLGQMYSCGEGVPPDYEEVHAKLAMTWYRRAADQGHAEAQYSLGEMYESGCGDDVPQDVEEALALFREAAKQGHVEAQFHLGHMYSCGEGVSEDDEAAVTWYRKAANQGHPGAQHYLGEMYDRGWGVPKDAVEAMAWYRKAAQRGDGVYSRAAQLALGNAYRTGNGVPTDAAAAVEWYRRAAAEGDLTARFALGEMYARGEGVLKNPEAAVTWFRRDNTGEQTVPVPLDVVPWVAFQRKKAESGDARAQFDLGWMHHHGEGVAADAATAAAWYRKAADQGDARAQFNLGVMHTLREGLPRDLVIAHMWFDVARTSTATGQSTLFDGDLQGSTLAAMEAIEGDMAPSEIAEATLFTAAWMEWFKTWRWLHEDFIDYLTTYLTDDHGMSVEAACEMADRFQQES